MYTTPKVYSFTQYLFIYLSTLVFSVSIPQRIILFSIHWFYFLRMSFFFYKIEIDCWCFKINVYFPMRGNQRANNTCNTSQVNNNKSLAITNIQNNQNMNTIETQPSVVTNLRNKPIQISTIFCCHQFTTLSFSSLQHKRI